MQANPRSHGLDPELGTSQGPSRGVAPEFVREHTRIIINPFLVLLGWSSTGYLLQLGLKTRDPGLSLAALMGLLLSTLLIQYHCLDCGETGWAIRAARHLCPLAAARAFHVLGRPWRKPTITTQLKARIAIALIIVLYLALTAAANP